MRAFCVVFSELFKHTGCTHITGKSDGVKLANVITPFLFSICKHFNSINSDSPLGPDVRSIQAWAAFRTETGVKNAAMEIMNIIHKSNTDFEPEAVKDYKNIVESKRLEQCEKQLKQIEAAHFFIVDRVMSEIIDRVPWTKGADKKHKEFGMSLYLAAGEKDNESWFNHINWASNYYHL